MFDARNINERVDKHKDNISRAKNVPINKTGAKRIGIHDFRHSHVSNLIANGVNIVAVSKRIMMNW